jgi:hypothetical protein
MVRIGSGLHSVLADRWLSKAGVIGVVNEAYSQGGSSMRQHHHTMLKTRVGRTKEQHCLRRSRSVKLDTPVLERIFRLDCEKK